MEDQGDVCSDRPEQRGRKRLDYNVRSLIRSFADRATEDIFDGAATRAARRRCPPAVLRVARRKLTQLNQVDQLRYLAVPPGNRLERLRGDRAGQYSIRINDRYRICFVWEPGYADDVEVTDYH